MNTYTNEQLSLALAKMLPDTFNVDEDIVFETEWLHVCWLIEQTFVLTDKYIDYLSYLPGENPVSASWQTRTIALAKMKGVEIV